jgi:hypothetical protein
MEQWKLLLLVAFFALLRWLFRGGGLQDILGGGDKEDQPPSPRQAQPEETEEERVRKFMKALGVPPTQTPPRRVPPPAVQKTRDVPVPRRAPAKPAYVPKIVPLPQPVKAAVAPATEPMSAQMAAVEEAYKAGTEFKAVAAVPLPEIKGMDVRALLKSPDSIRTAVILRELLGPPRSLQSFSSTPNVL